MEYMKMLTKTDKIFFSFTQDDKVYVIGSRKVNQIDLSAEFDGYDITSLYGRSASGIIPMPPSYNLTGSMRGFIQVVGDTFEEALFNLLLAFREEEQEEKEQAMRLAESAAQRQAFNEDYYANYYDGEDDEDYYEDGCDCWGCDQR